LGTRADYTFRAWAGLPPSRGGGLASARYALVRHMQRLLWTTVVFAAAAVTASAHANSVSYASYSLDGRTVHAVVRLPLDDVDLLLRLDRDLDGQVSGGELDASSVAIRAYLARHMRVVADGSTLAETGGRVTAWRDQSGFVYLEGELWYRASEAIGKVAIHTDFLTELYKSHKTLGQVFTAGHEEPFSFDATATYERRIATDRMTAVAIAVVGVAILGLLVIVRRRATAAAVGMVLVAAAAQADVIMSASALNATLKKIEKLKQQTAADVRPEREEALFQLAAEADGLAAIMNLEVESHGMQERALLDLALSRTKELDVGVAYNRDKKKFFYDGAAFAEYLKSAPHGAQAATAEFKLLSYRFYQSSGVDIAALNAAVDAKKRFLVRYPGFASNAELRLYLAVDYRDLHRLYLQARDNASAAASRQLARAECLRIVRQYPGSDQADAARQLLRGLTAR
jgi:hypothetical protein